MTTDESSGSVSHNGSVPQEKTLGIFRKFINSCYFLYCLKFIIFSWQAIKFLEHFYCCLFLFLTSYVPPPEVQFWKFI